MARTSSSKCPPALSVDEESKGRVAQTINLETNRVPHHAGFACGAFDSALSRLSRIHRNHSTAVIAVQPSFSTVRHKTLNIFIKVCYSPPCIPNPILALRSFPDLAFLPVSWPATVPRPSEVQVSPGAESPPAPHLSGNLVEGSVVFVFSLNTVHGTRQHSR